MDAIRTGAGVYCGADRVGKVAKLVADASDSHVTDMVVDRGLLHGAKLIPLGQVQDVRGDEVHLALDREQFQRADGFADQKYSHPHETWSVPEGYAQEDFLIDVQMYAGSPGGYGPGGDPGSPPSTPLASADRPNLLRPVVQEGTAIHAANGQKVGEIAQVSFDPSDGHLTGLMMKSGLLGHEHTTLPLDWVHDVDDAGVSLRVSVDEVHRLEQGRSH